MNTNPTAPSGSTSTKTGDYPRTLSSRSTIRLRPLDEWNGMTAVMVGLAALILFFWLPLAWLITALL